MTSYNNPNINGVQQAPIQFPYGNNVLLNNSPYDNYMGNNRVGNQNLFSNQFLKCRPVSSREEANAFQIDLDGSLWVFTDIGNGKIYTKQINNDGTASFKTYIFTEEKLPSYNNSPNDFITREEFNKVISGLTAVFQSNSSNSNIPETATNPNNEKLIGF